MDKISKMFLFNFLKRLLNIIMMQGPLIEKSSIQKKCADQDKDHKV